jgi:DNA-binding NarL/FixJ family response regulator
MGQSETLSSLLSLPSAMGKPRILLADDDAALLEGVQKLLEAEFEIVASVRDGYALIEAAKSLGPDVIVTDISMPLFNGLRAVRHLKKNQPNARIIFLTVHDERPFVAEALKVGASGYVVKRSAHLDLLPALREVLRGGSFVSAAAQE